MREVTWPELSKQYVEQVVYEPGQPVYQTRFSGHNGV